VTGNTRALVLATLTAQGAWAGAADDGAALLRDANRSLHACDIARALVKYRAAFDRTQHAAILLYIADALRLIGKRVEAARTYEKYLAHPGADPAERPGVEKKLVEIDREIGRLRVQPAESGRVRIDGDVAGEGAEVRARVDPGAHAVTLERDDAVRAATVVRVAAGEVRVVTFGKPETPAAPEPPVERSRTGGLAAAADTLAKACKLLDAIDKYRAAQEVAPKGRVARHLGDALRRAGRPAEAAGAYQDSLLLGKDPSGKVQAERSLHDLDAEVGKVRFASIAPGAKLLVDGRPTTIGPEGFARLDPGSHMAFVELDGTVRAAETFIAPGGAETSVMPQSIEALPEAAPEAGSGAVLEPPAAPTATPGAEAPAPAPAAATEAAAPHVASQTATHALPPTAEEAAGHDGQMSAVLEGSANVRTGDVGPTIGVAFGVGPSFEFSVLVLDQELTGVRLAGTWLILPEPALKPYVQAGMPIFSQDGVRAGVRGAVGVCWDFTGMTGISADVAVERFPNMPAPYDKTYVLVSAGIAVRSPR
jgi:tetratricopeptide (TPR) repeat protein